MRNMEQIYTGKINVNASKTSPEIKEVKFTVKSKKRNMWLLYLVIFGFAVYSVITIVNQSIAIEAKKAELQKIQNKIVVQEIKNDDLKEVNNFTEQEKEEYIEQVARDTNGYVKSGERVFINVSGE